MFSRQQWNAVVFVSLLLVAMVLVLRTWSRNINGPIQELIAENEKNKNSVIFGVNTNQTLTDQELRSKDTDKDGLNDYEESYIYRTSVYLPDTDSDGTSDKDEIAQGLDPVCAKGEDCKLASAQNQKEILKPEENSLAVSEDVDLSEIPEETLGLILSGQADNDQIKSFLILQGLDESIVDSLDENALQSVYRSTLDKLTQSE